MQDYCYPDGYRQALIVHDDNAFFAKEYDEEFSITLSDWYHEMAEDIKSEFMNLYNPTGAEPIPDAFLVNDTTPAGPSPVLTYDTLRWWFDVERRIRAQKSVGNGYTLKDVCFNPTGDACVVQSVTGYFQPMGSGCRRFTLAPSLSPNQGLHSLVSTAISIRQVATLDRPEEGPEDGCPSC